MIKSPNLKKFRTSEHIQFITDVGNLCVQNQPEILQIESPLEALQKSTAELETVFKQDKGSQITQEIQTLDDRRDEAYVCISVLTEGYTHHFNKKMSEAACLLDDCIRKYGRSAYRLNYQAETSIINNLLSDVRNTEKYADAVKVLGLGDLFAEMEAVNDQFNKRFLARITESAEDSSESSIEWVKTTTKHYRTLTDHITAHSIINPKESYTVLINQLNTLTEKYNEILAHRMSTKSEEPEVEEEIAD